MAYIPHQIARDYLKEASVINGGASIRNPNKKQRHEDDEQGKLFVGGLSWDTTQESLLRYFSRFGEVIDCVVMRNQETGRSRRFGFVTFSNPSNVDDVLASCPHSLDGRTIDPKSCNPRSMQKPKRTSTSSSLPKVFLGGLPSSITETDLRTFFSRYGEVCEVVIMYDQEKKKSRGFGFLSFADESSCSRAVMDHYVTIQNKKVEVKRAEPRSNSSGDHQANGTTSNYGSGEFWSPPVNQQQVTYGAPPPSLPINSPVSQGGWAMPPPPQPQARPPQTTCVFNSPPPVHVASHPQSFWHPVPTPPPAPPQQQQSPQVEYQKWAFTTPGYEQYHQQMAPPPALPVASQALSPPSGHPHPQQQQILLTSPPPQKLPYNHPTPHFGGGEFYQSAVFGQPAAATAATAAILPGPAAAAEYIANGGLGPQRVTAATSYTPSQPLSQVQSYHPYRRS